MSRRHGLSEPDQSVKAYTEPVSERLHLACGAVIQLPPGLAVNHVAQNGKHVQFVLDAPRESNAARKPAQQDGEVRAL